MGSNAGPKTGEPVSETSKNGEVHTLVFADDDPDDQYVIRTAIKALSLGVQVKIFDDGRDMLRYFSEIQEMGKGCQNHLIFLDLNMRHTDGFDTLKAIRGNASLCGLPVIVLSTSDMARDVKQSYELGANSYVVKPASYSEMEHFLEQAYHYWFGPVVLGPFAR